MRISAVIPVHNGAKTIELTLASVFSQIVPADEILVLDDGSTDDTAAIVKEYGKQVTLVRQENRGVAPTRNALCSRAQGDLIAFLDADDLWHPNYLQVQRRVFAENQGIASSFTGHVNFSGYGPYKWNEKLVNIEPKVEIIEPLEFLKRYNQATGPFASMSYCCVPKIILTSIGPEPFQVSGVDDSYLFTLLPLLGPVAYSSVPLVAYRVTAGAQSVNRLKIFGAWVRVFEILKERYERQEDPQLKEAFRAAFASKRRQFGKLLMAAGRTSEAREEFWRSAWDTRIPLSILKSMALLLASYVPLPLQPRWPPLYREWNESE